MPLIPRRCKTVFRWDRVCDKSIMRRCTHSDMNRREANPACSRWQDSVRSQSRVSLHDRRSSSVASIVAIRDITTVGWPRLLANGVPEAQEPAVENKPRKSTSNATSCGCAAQVESTCATQHGSIVPQYSLPNHPRHHTPVRGELLQNSPKGLRGG